MKGPEYVSRVVRAYRLLLDTPDADYEQAASEAENLLAESLAGTGPRDSSCPPRPNPACLRSTPPRPASSWDRSWKAGQEAAGWP
jgi:hypothetical protein